MCDIETHSQNVLIKRIFWYFSPFLIHSLVYFYSALINTGIHSQTLLEYSLGTKKEDDITIPKSWRKNYDLILSF